jgi:hypothetical protein
VGVKVGRTVLIGKGVGVGLPAMSWPREQPRVKMSDPTTIAATIQSRC